MPTFSKLQLIKDTNANVTFGLPFPKSDEQAFQFLLAVDTEQTLTVPLNMTIAKFTFSVGTNVWVRRGSVAVTRPVVPGPVAQNSELNPILRNVDAGDTLRFICETPAEVNVVFYPNPQGTSHVF